MINKTTTRFALIASVLMISTILLFIPMNSNTASMKQSQEIIETPRMSWISAYNINYTTDMSALGFTGTGSYGDPYIIEDLIINGSDFEFGLRF